MVFKSFKTGRARCPQRAVGFRRVKSCCRTLAVTVTFCAASAVLSSFADGLPDGYTQLPYIKANKNVQLLTGYTPAATDKIVMTWYQPQGTALQTLWCARSGYTVNSFTVFAYSGKMIGINYNDASLSNSSTPDSFTVNKRDDLAASTKYTIIADGNAKTLAVTNAFTGAEVVNVSWTVANDFTVGSQLCLFASHKDNETFIYRDARFLCPKNW